MTQDANFENFYFVLILHLILGKVRKFLVEKLSTSEVISKKPHRGMENTPSPSAFRVKVKLTKNSNPIELMNNIIYSWYLIMNSFNSSVGIPHVNTQPYSQDSFGAVTSGDNHVVCWSGGTFSITSASNNLLTFCFTLSLK